jgi:hypothetical protein
LGERPFEKIAGKKGEESEVYICRTFGWNSEFPEVCSEPLGYIKSLTGLVQDL